MSAGSGGCVAATCSRTGDHPTGRITVVAMAASLLAAFRHLGLPNGDLRKASIKSLRFRLFEVPGRITYGQRKTWLHLPADWPWTPDLTTSWQTIKTLPIPI